MDGSIILVKKNNGPYKSRMDGIKNLKPLDEDIIVLIDGDDKLHDNKVFEKLNDRISR